MRRRRHFNTNNEIYTRGGGSCGGENKGGEEE